jgi:DNA-binding XRE family transcriptional regulator
MPNIASILKEEISRVARKEVRAETQSLKKSSAHYRGEIAALKRTVQSLERLVVRLSKGEAVVSAPTAVSTGPKAVQRFSAARMVALRKRLDLSAAEAGRLLGVSALTVYNWEKGTKPRATHLPAIAGLRALSKAQARRKLKTT